MTPNSAPSKIYTAPGYVNAFSIAGLLCIAVGLFSVFIAVQNEESPWTGVALVLAGFVNFLYGQIADAIARTNWRTELMAHELAPLIERARVEEAVREKEESARQRAQEEEIGRVLSPRTDQL